MDELKIEIRPSQKDELDLIHSVFSPNSMLRNHHERHALSEKGEAVYLIAWHQGKPIGHFCLRWAGPGRDLSDHYPYPTAYLEGGGTGTAFRRKGVATRMIQKAEELVSEKGLKRIGLAVGSTDNPDAKRLYAKLGYRDWGEGEVTVSWEYRHTDGSEGIESEVCIYMFKDL